MTEANKKVKLGTVKLVDAVKGLGVIAPRADETDTSEPEDLFFQTTEVKRTNAWRLQEGQLVQFVMGEIEGVGPVAKEIEVLSNMGSAQALERRRERRNR